MRCFATLSMTRQERTHRCHAERSAAESKYLIPWGLCVTSLSHLKLWWRGGLAPRLQA